MEQQKFLNIREVSNLLAISKSSIYRLLDRGQFPRGAYLRGSRRWNTDELTTWAAKQAQKAEQEEA